MKILMLGNSYTFFNDMPVKLAKLTGAEVVGNLRGGACLWQQLDPNDDLGKKCAALLAQKDWDYIVLQEHSRGTFEFPKEFFDASRKLCMIAREMGATPVFYCTWAYQRGGKLITDMKLDHDEMFKKINAAYHKAAEDNNALIADVGARFYTDEDPDSLFDPDGSHPNDKGSALAASIIADVIFKNEEHKQK